MRCIFLVFLFELLWAATPLHGIEGKERPNIVVLYSDDAGYADFGFQPNVVAEMKDLTPNIDSIARDGARFSNAYMSGCVCSPSRAGLMTGRYQSRFGFDNNIPPGTKSGLPLGETFISERMQSLGYQTGLIGKWHLGYPPEFQPNQRGWDHFYGILQGSRSYLPIKKPSPHRVFLENSKPVEERGYVTDRIGEAACQFITENKQQPFFLFVSFTAPHSPLEAKESDLKRLSHIEKQKRRKYAGLVVSLDDNVGRILKTIEKHELESKTLVLFTNDNGGQTLTGAVNTPLRGAKGTLFEGGIRVPWAVRWPGRIKPATVVDEPVIAIDLLPTFVAVGGGKVRDAWKLDGRNLVPLLDGEDESKKPRAFFWRKHGSKGIYAIRDGKWKMIIDKSDKSELPGKALFDLSADIRESKNVLKEFPDVASRLESQLEKWSKELHEPLWGPNAKKKTASPRATR